VRHRCPTQCISPPVGGAEPDLVVGAGADQRSRWHRERPLGPVLRLADPQLRRPGDRRWPVRGNQAADDNDHDRPAAGGAQPPSRMPPIPDRLCGLPTSILPDRGPPGCACLQPGGLRARARLRAIVSCSVRKALRAGPAIQLRPGDQRDGPATSRDRVKPTAARIASTGSAGHSYRKRTAEGLRNSLTRPEPNAPAKTPATG
jgi:hypothetical protein